MSTACSAHSTLLRPQSIGIYYTCIACLFAGLSTCSVAFEAFVFNLFEFVVRRIVRAAVSGKQESKRRAVQVGCCICCVFTCSDAVLCVQQQTAAAKTNSPAQSAVRTGLYRPNIEHPRTLHHLQCFRCPLLVDPGSGRHRIPLCSCVT